MLPAIALLSIQLIQNPKDISDAKDDCAILTALYHRREKPGYLEREYWGERGSFKAKIERHVKSTQKALERNHDDNAYALMLSQELTLLSKILSRVQDEVEKPSPPVIPILELGLGKDIRINPYDLEAYMKEPDKYAREITLHLRERSLIDSPTPPAYSANGHFAILTNHFFAHPHGWNQDIVFEKAKDSWKIIYLGFANWGGKK